MKWITMSLEEYKEHVLEINDARDSRARLDGLHNNLNRALYLLLNELHQRHDLAEFVTFANDHQDTVRFDLSKGIVTLKFVNNEDPDTEDQDPDDEPPEVPQWDFGYNKEGA